MHSQYYKIQSSNCKVNMTITLTAQPNIKCYRPNIKSSLNIEAELYIIKL